MMAGMLQAQGLNILDNEAVKAESYMMEKEVRAILEKVFEIGEGDVVVGTKRAIEIGVLDQPYATTQLVKGKVMGVKDSEGAARFFDFGELPFDREIMDYHKEKIRERESRIRKQVGYETIINDMMAISNGAIVN
jgi:methylaspartate mutase epsilon subunit